jgi:hypothetical protein
MVKEVRRKHRIGEQHKAPACAQSPGAVLCRRESKWSDRARKAVAWPGQPVCRVTRHWRGWCSLQTRGDGSRSKCALCLLFSRMPESSLSATKWSWRIEKLGLHDESSRGRGRRKV